eukprot:Tbor_TRINITY_DN3073_c0_g1::TRINITY_DN3073_c0_g1_i1::g.17417::m.17417/K14376/PAP; poly(A) polymerase
MPPKLFDINTPGHIPRHVVQYDPPDASERKLSEILGEWCETQIEPESEANQRRHAIVDLSELMKSWITSVMINKHRMSKADADRYEGKLFTTGSYRYNVHTTGSDIDAVLVAPEGLSVEDFFSTFAERLRREQWVTEMILVKNAKVPIISMKCHGIDMDLSFTSIRREKVPVAITDDLLKGLDMKYIISASAVRVAQTLLEYAPEKFNFRQSLRFIKSWAKFRGIHGSQFGFPTGIGWALLVCRACQAYPNRSPAGVLVGFFRFYTNWFRESPFETGRPNPPIFLNAEQIRGKTELGESWDPTNRFHAQAYMPVLTPVAPSTNSCDMIGEFTFRIICSELRRGTEFLSKNFNEASATDDEYPFAVWSKLLEPYPFFETHEHFLCVSVSCSATRADLYRPYVDAVEVRIKELYSFGRGLDIFEGVSVRPWPKRFEEPTQREFVDEYNRVVSSNGANAAGEASNLKPLPKSPNPLLTAYFYIGIDVKKRPGEPAPQFQLVEITRAFKEKTRKFTNSYVEGVTRLPAFSLVKSYTDLPLWVFDPSKSKVLAARKKKEEELAMEAKAKEDTPNGDVNGDREATQNSPAALISHSAKRHRDENATLSTTRIVDETCPNPNEGSGQTLGNDHQLPPIPSFTSGVIKKKKNERKPLTPAISMDSELGMDF